MTTLAERIQKVLSGQSGLDGENLGLDEEGNAVDISPVTATQMIESFGLEEDEPVETNGWSADYWIKYSDVEDPDSKSGETHDYMLSGTMFYGTANFKRVK